jgi:hypothetical protein
MIAYDIQGGRYSAANLAAAVQPTELTGSLVSSCSFGCPDRFVFFTMNVTHFPASFLLTVARQLAVISEKNTDPYSKGLKKIQKEDAATMVLIEDDPELVELSRKYKGRILFDKDDGKTWKVRCVQYDDRKIDGKDSKYYEATVVEVVRGVNGAWVIPESSYVEGANELLDSALAGYYLLDVTDPDNTEVFPDVDEMAQAHGDLEAKRKRSSQAGGGAAAGGSGRAKKRRK